ncbi:MAG TPA: EAL domain-containing protein [Pilimelia sp.]|nr:EAL domain-containing protein [Pilimelia sp.]
MAFPAFRRVRRAAALRRAPAVPLAAGVLLVAGLVGIVPSRPALAAAIGGAGAVAATRLIRLARAIRAAEGRFGSCRGAGLLGLGVLAGALTPVASMLAPPHAAAATTTVGVLVAAAAYLSGLMLLPGAATTVAARVRRGLDGLGIAASLSFAAWLALPPVDAMPGPALAAAGTGIGALSVAAVVGARAVRHRRAALRCAAGAGVAILGLTALALLTAYRAPAAALLAAGVPLVAGPSLVWAGARRAEPGDRQPPPGETGGTLAGYPLLTVPVALAVLTAAVHLVTVGAFDRASIALGLVAVTLLAAREALTTGDIRRYARRLAQQEAHYRGLVSGAHDLILVLDGDLLVRWQSAAAARLFGLSDADVLGRPFPQLLHPDDAPATVQALLGVLTGAEDVDPERPVLLTARLRDGFGRWRETESTVGDRRGVPEGAALVLHLRDIGERRRLERAVHRLSGTDQLTGLANRRELLRTIAVQRGLTERCGALLVVELHDLATVNDGWGREAGDAVVLEAARRLRAVAGPDDVPARLGEDGFALLTLAGPVAAYALGARLLAELRRPYELPGDCLRLGASAGLAELGGPAGQGPDAVLHHADLARRWARQLGGDRVEWYDACVADQLTRRMDIERELPGALDRGELDLVFQPVVRLLDRRPAGAEALLRWRHPRLGAVAPAELVPVAEELDLIADIGEWVLDAACRQLAVWAAHGRRLWIAVNISPRHLLHPEFVTRVGRILAAHRLAPERLVVELPQDRLPTHSPALVTALAALRATGVRVALDDVALGQASLPLLRRLPVDLLKFDAALITPPAGRRAAADHPSAEVVVELGRRLGLELVAECLENRERLDAALAAGCRLGQGFVLGRPVPAEHIEAYLEDHRTPLC